MQDRRPQLPLCVGDKGYVYVSSYVAPVQEDINAPKGAVFKVDTLSMQIVGSVEVGYQPEEMTVVGDRLYVANSGATESRIMTTPYLLSTCRRFSCVT